MTSKPTPSLETLSSQIDRCLTVDRRRLLRDLRSIRKRQREGKPFDRKLSRLLPALEESIRKRRQRESNRPKATFGFDLPVVDRREEIAALIRENQVVVVCGETGSGKTTQLPKICLELDRGGAGMIGHTQPRRIAARTVANRIAEELQTPVGRGVGYKVRFSEKTSDDTSIKVMTDGMLLAETQSDRFLEAYDTIIIDEAHERSLNIDFLLGYLKRLLAKRPDLKVIITSATIDPQRFSEHFDDAPIIEVSGRTYPVEMRYRPLESADAEQQDRDTIDAIADAVDECMGEGPGDMLIFLPGERDIRFAAEKLRKRHAPQTEVLPLYARLSTTQQNKVFEPPSDGANRRIVLATNVAETSLTVPNIRYVIDPGTARISRYSATSKVQRLPIEPVSQASAKQRAGRCGRIGPGVCIRLFTEEDFAGRSEFTQPEILRSNLAGVILQMESLRLGNVERFPFVDPPKPAMIRAGYKTLHELGAIDEHDELTDLGRELASLPVDPRIGRIILAGRDENCLTEAIILSAALSLSDPRLRPMDARETADEAHAKFVDERSDFLTLLGVWDFYHQQKRKGTWKKLRQVCRRNFLSFVRLREWTDITRQLRAMMKVNNAQFNRERAEPEAIHRAVLAGLLSHIGLNTEGYEYTSAGGRAFYLFPGSVLFDKKPTWVMAAELVETTKLYARTVASIRPQWVEDIGSHLVKRRYADPHWSRERSRVRAYETVTIFGLEIIPKRLTHYGPINPEESREIFISQALAEEQFDTDAKFFEHNSRLIEKIRNLEARQRKRDLLVDSATRYAFYDARIPAHIYTGRAFERWRRKAEKDNPQLLFMSEADLLRDDATSVSVQQLPDQITLREVNFPLRYNLEPGTQDDGVTILVPVEAINHLDADRLTWLVPGMRKEKAVELIRTLPKSIRRNFVPAPDFAEAALSAIENKTSAETFHAALGETLHSVTGIEIPADGWRPNDLPRHLKMNIRVVDDNGETITAGRDLYAIRESLGEQSQKKPSSTVQSELSREGLTTWDFDDLPRQIEIKRAGMAFPAYPALADQTDSVAIGLFDSAAAADAAHRQGLRRLVLLQFQDEIEYQRDNIPGLEAMCEHYATLGECAQLRNEFVAAVLDRAFFPDPTQVRSKIDFQDALDTGWRKLETVTNETAQLTETILQKYHEVELLLAQPTPPQWEEAIDDLNDQLLRMIPPDFLTATPDQWLLHLPRYLDAMIYRHDKLSGGGWRRDRDNLDRLATLRNKCFERIDRNRFAGIYDPALTRYRWMLEEQRVALFAQPLGKAITVSMKRLEKQWEQVRR